MEACCREYLSVTVFSIYGNTKFRSFFVNCSLTGKSQVFRHGETYQPVVPVFLHQMHYYHHYLQHSALCTISSSIVTQRPLVEGEVQHRSSAPHSAIKGSGEAIRGHFLFDV